jgi:ABC-2 type transport system ATP-binding protein
MRLAYLMHMTSSSMIKTKNLTKKFGNLVAVNGVDLDIKKGEVFGLLGPNGAGKTTLISMLSMILVPTSGSAKISGYDISKDQSMVRKKIGIVFQDPSLDDRLTARENLELHAMLYGLDKKSTRERIEKVLKLVELQNRSNDLVRTYSGGMRRRLEIARGLIHYPRVLFLDEPTLGLDPQTREHIWNYIKKLAERENITIVMTTHYMEEADALCNRIAIIDNGRIIALDTPKKLKRMIGSETIIVKIKDSDNPAVKEKIMKAFPNSKEFDGKVVLYVKDAEKNIKKVFDKSRKAGIEILEASIHKPTLNDVFLHLTGKEIREEKANAKDNMRYHRMRRGHR